jgi:heme/copper-type cytochrome/quinol oxidase subunit 3
MSDVSPALQEPWPDLAVQRTGVSVGIWAFLASEILFFSGLFISYTVYRLSNEQAFQVAGKETELFYGTLNTTILLTSSMTMTVALRTSGARLRQLTIACLAITAVLGLAFLFCKGLEYRDDLTKHLFPGANFPLKPPQTELFWMLYWIMTGIHAVHLSAGIVVVIAVLVLFSRRVVPVQDSTMEGVATYWHFVDSVWLVLYPLLYLVGRS